MATGVLTLANQLTLLRMALAPVLVLLVLSRRFRWALVVFVVASVTDLLDGLIARLGHQKTTLGAMLDPIADKLLLSSSFVVLTWGPGLHVAIPLWLTVIALSRDLIIVVSVTVINLTLGRRIFYPSLLGKLTTGSQLVTAALVLLLNTLALRPSWLDVVFLITVSLTVASALHYVYASAHHPGREA